MCSVPRDNCIPKNMQNMIKQNNRLWKGKWKQLYWRFIEHAWTLAFLWCCLRPPSHFAPSTSSFAAEKRETGKTCGIVKYGQLITASVRQLHIADNTLYGHNYVDTWPSHPYVVRSQTIATKSDVHNRTGCLVLLNSDSKTYGRSDIIGKFAYL